MRATLLAPLAALGLHAAVPQDSPPAAAEALRTELEHAGIRLDLEAGVVAIEATVDVRSDLLEYLLVGRDGAAHESLLVTAVRPSLLNVALLALGAVPGLNARWSLEGTGVGEERILPPEGGGFYLHAAWREGDEVFFYRIEDLIANLASGRSMRRDRWVYLGSRLARPSPDEGEVFVADLEQNLINLTFFYQGNTLLTAALPECVDQSIWIANSWLLPPRDAPILLLLSRTPLAGPPAGWAETLPRVAPRPGTSEGTEEGG